MNCKGKKGMSEQPCLDQPLNDEGYCIGHEEAIKLSEGVNTGRQQSKMEAKITIEETEKIFIRTSVMSGKHGETPIAMSLNIDGKVLIFEYGAKSYTISMQSIVEGAIEAINK